MIYPVDRAIHLLNKLGPLIYSMVWPFKLKVVVGWRRQYLYSLALVFFLFFFTMDLNFDVKNKWAVIAWINPWRSIFSFLRFDDWKLAITNAEAKTWGSHLQQIKLFHAHRSSVSSEELLSIFMNILLDFYIWMINIYFEIKITAVKRVKRRRFHYLFYENLFIMYSIFNKVTKESNWSSSWL